MVLCVLSIVFFKLDAMMLLLLELSLDLFTHLLLDIQVLLEHLLIISLLFGLLLIVTVELLEGCFVLLGDLTNQHAVVSSAAVL